MVTVDSITRWRHSSMCHVRLVFDDSDRVLIGCTWMLPESAHLLLRLCRVRKVAFKTTCNLSGHLCKFYDVPLNPGSPNATDMFIDTNVAW